MQKILGQSHAVNVIQAALRAGRVHHAWIFGGPIGVGKFTCAIEFARILLDPEATANLAGEIAADPDSRSSRLIDAGTHPDLHVIRKELARYSRDPQLRDRKLTNIPIDVLRERMIGGVADDPGAQAPVYRTAAMGHGKVFIIDEAELLDENCQNAILKTLEEPPRETYLVLVTSRPDRLLPTIRSRCQFVQFGLLDPPSMQAWIKQSGLDLAPKEQAWIEQFAEGAPGIAQLAAEYGFFGWRETIAPMLAELLRGSFPAALGETMAKLIDDFAIAWVKNHGNASKDAANKSGARHMFAMLAAFARRQLAREAEAGGDAEKWMNAIDAIHDAERSLGANVNQKMVLENLIVQWCRELSPVPA